jgi:hypothetical protein
MTNCTVTYVESLIAILLAFAAADFMASLLQFGASVGIVCRLNLELSDGEAYKIVSNLTNYTIESIEDPQRPPLQTHSNLVPQSRITEPQRK